MKIIGSLDPHFPLEDMMLIQGDGISIDVGCYGLNDDHFCIYVFKPDQTMTIDWEDLIIETHESNTYCQMLIDLGKVLEKYKAELK